MIQPNPILGKTLDKWAVGVSAFVLIAVVAMRVIPKPDALPDFMHYLPKLHAVLNTLCAVSLLSALYFVKNKNIALHRRSIYAAMTFSALFLVSYVLYHTFAIETKYGDLNHDHLVDAAELVAAGSMRTVYFFFLATHIILAASILPFIFFTFIRGYTHQVPQHKRLAHWTFPLWLYVAVTGPICYFMLAPYY